MQKLVFLFQFPSALLFFQNSIYSVDRYMYVMHEKEVDNITRP